MSPEELSRAQIRMTAMHAAITLYCCHRDTGGDHGGDTGDDHGGHVGITPEQLGHLLPILVELRDKLLETALFQGSSPV